MKKKCIRNIGKCYMHPIKESGSYQDLNGKKHPQFREYDCDCGSIHELDMEKNIWMC